MTVASAASSKAPAGFGARLRRHPFAAAFAGLSAVAVLFSFLIHWAVFGYVFEPAAPPVRSLVHVDALFAYGIDPYVKPTTAQAGLPPEPPSAVLKARPAPAWAESRLLAALDQKGLLPPEWHWSSSLTAADVVRMLVAGEGAYGVDPADIRYVGGYVLQGRDSSGRQCVVVSAVDNTGFPARVPVYEFVFTPAGPGPAWKYAQHAT
jgi:hypothetical protein